MYSCDLHDRWGHAGSSRHRVILMTQESVRCLSCTWSDIWEQCLASSWCISVLWRKLSCALPMAQTAQATAVTETVILHVDFLRSLSVWWLETQASGVKSHHDPRVLWLTCHDLKALPMSIFQCFWTRMKFICLWIIGAVSTYLLSSAGWNQWFQKKLLPVELSLNRLSRLSSLGLSITDVTYITCKDYVTIIP